MELTKCKYCELAADFYFIKLNINTCTYCAEIYDLHNREVELVLTQSEN